MCVLCFPSMHTFTVQLCYVNGALGQTNLWQIGSNRRNFRIAKGVIIKGSDGEFMRCTGRWRFIVVYARLLIVVHDGNGRLSLVDLMRCLPDMSIHIMPSPQLVKVVSTLNNDPKVLVKELFSRCPDDGNFCAWHHSLSVVSRNSIGIVQSYN